MTKYQELLSNFESSGLTQKQYALQIGKSASNLCTMLKRARQEQSSSVKFQRIEIKPSTAFNIKISLSNGTIIEIPI